MSSADFNQSSTTTELSSGGVGGTDLAERLSRLSGARIRESKPRPIWQNARVVKLTKETAETTSIQFEPEHPAEFLPGQYYNVRIPVPGRPRPIQRAYSIGSSPFPDASRFEITVREVPGGLVSPRLTRDLRVGDVVEVRGPHGNFTWTEKDDGPVLLIAAGSGVVPFMSMIRYAAIRELSFPMLLLFSSKTEDLVIYTDELAGLQREHSWLEVVHTFTRSPGHPGSRYHRRIDAEMVQECLKELSGNPVKAIGYVCGSPDLVDMAQATLLAAGLREDRVRVEKYD